jgi:hypothetical protein
LIALASVSPLFGQAQWKPLNPADNALKSSQVEPDADAEVIFWEVRVADEISGQKLGSKMLSSSAQIVRLATTVENYIRLKVFNERGRETQSKIDIPFLGSWKVDEVAARTISPDGSIVELQKDSIFERTIVKANGVKLKAKSFILPKVEPGSIVEYRWKERRTGVLADHLRLPFQRDIPVQEVRYYIRPLQSSVYGVRAQTFNGVATPFTQGKDGFYSVSMSKVPAFHPEPYMPPEATVRPWMLFYYIPDEKLEGDEFWKIFSTVSYERMKEWIKVSDGVKVAAINAIGDAVSPEDRLERLLTFCRTRIKNSGDDAADISVEERAKLKVNKSPADTLKNGVGTRSDIQMLFAALAKALEFDARVVWVGDRGDYFFDKNFPDPYFIRSLIIGVKIGDEWRFFDPASTYATYGTLAWQQEYQEALVSDPAKPLWVNTPLAPPRKSLIKRTARLNLSEDGTLEGDLQIEYSGHAGAERKEVDDDSSPAEREEAIRNAVKAQISNAEVSNIQIQNVTDPIKPLVQSYHVRVPGYGQRTAKRLFLQPAFFEYGVNPFFPASQRKYDVYFKYPWSEQDEIFIQVPDALVVEPLPADTTFGSDVSRYTSSLRAEGRSIVFRREFSFGEKNSIIFPVKKYPPLKAHFDKVHAADNQAVTLSPKAN